MNKRRGKNFILGLSVRQIPCEENINFTENFIRNMRTAEFTFKEKVASFRVK